MKFKKVFFFVFCANIFTYLLMPQNLKSDDLGKANKYYEKYDYQFAIEIYEKLMEKKPSLEVAQKLANSYKFTNKIDAAEKAYAKVLTYPNFDPSHYINYADVLKQNGKFKEAKRNYLLYAERIPARSDYAMKLAQSCDLAEEWLSQPDPEMLLQNEVSFNTENSDFSPIPSKNGFLFVSDRWFVKSAEKKDKKEAVYGWTGNPFFKIYELEKNESGNVKLSLLPSEINDSYHNGPATISEDGETIYFTRVGVYNKKKSKSNIEKKTIFYSTKKNGIWGAAIPFPFNNSSAYSVQHPALSQDGKILYFSSDMPGGYGGMDLYYAEKTDTGWSKPVNCGALINSIEDDVFPYVRKDGTLYFSSRGHTTIGGLDIFSSNGSKSTWTEPLNLKAPLNSTRDDFGVYFFDDNLSGYISSNRQGGKGADDIYKFTKKVKEITFAIDGKVLDKNDGKALGGLKIYLINKTTGEETTTLSGDDGSFKFNLEKETDYIVRGDLDKFFARQEGNISTKGANETTVFNVKFEVQKGEDAFLVRLNNIYYDFDKSIIRKDAEPELDKVIAFMESTPQVQVELRSHTDARGSAAYNLKLSERRAISAKDYILKRGVEGARLSAKGFGETQLLNQCKDGVKCGKELHELNRRTEFKVVKVDPVLTYSPVAVSK
jgi:outer membrane protein OmpA-like peptidoglycan-associated protein